MGGELYLTNLPEERMARYRLMAANARDRAHNCKTKEAADTFMAVAAAWETMAVELQHSEETKQRLFGQSAAHQPATLERQLSGKLISGPN